MPFPPLPPSVPPSLSSCSFDFAKYLLNAYYVPDTLLGTGDSAANGKNKKSCLCGVYILVGEGQENK